MFEINTSIQMKIKKRITATIMKKGSHVLKKALVERNFPLQRSKNIILFVSNLVPLYCGKDNAFKVHAAKS